MSHLSADDPVSMQLTQGQGLTYETKARTQFCQEGACTASACQPHEKKKKSTDSGSMIFIQPEQNMRHSFVPSSVQVKKYIHNKRFNYPETGPFIAMQWLRVTGLRLET